ncbi:MAG: 50S ribosomal protein L6 [Gammaproteobacteria bacterium]|nr:50S ribosomal protein L6 [Gammaproteobacteria bacterium]
MSRIASNPVTVPKGVEVSLGQENISVKGSNGQLTLKLNELVSIKQEEDQLKFAGNNDSKSAIALAGTFRSLVNNMVQGVSQGFVKELQLQGVGYRAQVSGNSLNLTLGFSHPVVYQIPDGITIETPSQTLIQIKGADKQKVGQVAAEIRAYRPPEPYKGKGVRYVNEYVKQKEAKKK